MRHYTIKALRAGRQVVSLEYVALDELHAAAQARRDGFEVLLVRVKSWQFSKVRKQTFPLLSFSQELRTLVDAGIPLLEALRTLAEKERSHAVKRVLDTLVEVVNEGRRFSSALEQFPDVFPQLFVATISASEETGDMSPALLRYVIYQEQLNEIKKKVFNALIYPVLLFVVGGLVSLFLLLYVVPKFAQIYEDHRGALSWSSLLLVEWSKLLTEYSYLPAVLILGCAMSLFYIIRSSRFHRIFADVIRKIPAVGERLHLYQLTRFYRTVGMLLRSGIPLVDAFEMSAGILQTDLRPKLAQVVLEIRQGFGVTHSLEKQHLTTPVVLRMLSVGERSGNMGEMMERAADFHDEEIARWLEWFSRLFEPLLMLFIGVFIGAIVVAMYLPIFELIGDAN